MPEYLDPTVLIPAVGLIGIIAIIFAESGLFFGFFLPGDSLLFTAGIFASQGYFSISLLLFGTMIAAIVGDSVGYAFGKKVGPSLFSRENSLFFDRKHVERAHAFYEKHGVKTILFARFVPIVRTFAPIVAGIGSMPYKTFIAWNISGGILWTSLMTLSGYYLGRSFPHIGEYLEIIVIGIIAVSLIPVIIEFVRNRRGQAKAKV
jgi:membrane-associated protein